MLMFRGLALLLLPGGAEASTNAPLSAGDVEIVIEEEAGGNSSAVLFYTDPTGMVKIHPDVVANFPGYFSNSTVCLGGGFYCAFPAQAATYECGFPCGAYGPGSCVPDDKCAPVRSPKDFVWYPRRPVKLMDNYTLWYQEGLGGGQTEADTAIATANAAGLAIHKQDYDGGRFNESFPVSCNYTWTQTESTSAIVDNLFERNDTSPSGGAKYIAGEENDMEMSFWLKETAFLHTPACQALEPTTHYVTWNTESEAALVLFGVEGEEGWYGLTSFVRTQVNVTCLCVTSFLSSPGMALNNDPVSEKFVVIAIGERTFQVSINIFDDARLRDGDMYTPGSQFPQNKQFFYFVLSHKYKSDWSVHVQMSKCYSCADDGAGTACVEDSVESVVFYDCGPLLGGPQITPTASTWLVNYPFYHAVGMQKFRMTDTDSMVITCNVDGCSERPCDPCKGSRRSRSRKRILSQTRSQRAARKLQDALKEDEAPKNRVATRLYVPPDRYERVKPLTPAPQLDDGQKRRDEIKRRKDIRFLLRMLILVLLLVACIKAVFRMREQRAILKRQIRLAEQARRERESGKLGENPEKDVLELSTPRWMTEETPTTPTGREGVVQRVPVAPGVVPDTPRSVASE